MRVVVLVVLVAPFCLAGQGLPALKTSNPPHTADGQPDLQGVWTNSTLTPLERPAELAGKEFLTQQEAADYVKRTLQQVSSERRDGGAQVDVGRSYNEFWRDRGNNLVADRRTSLIVDPPDGRIPPLTPAAKKRVDEYRAWMQEHATDGPEGRSLAERCISWATAGPPMLPGPYNSNYQIFQAPGYVAISIEMIHDVRIIPLDQRPHLPGSVRQWLGDSRGHWEGNTLVVETTNFTGTSRFRGATDNMRLIERFTRTDANTLTYDFTVEDPAVFSKPWSASIPMSKSAGPIYEYACHEGNYAVPGILGGARKQEAANQVGK